MNKIQVVEKIYPKVTVYSKGEEVTHRECVICKERLPLSAFRKNKQHKYGLHNKCRKCEGIYVYQSQLRRRLREGDPKIHECTTEGCNNLYAGRSVFPYCKQCKIDKDLRYISYTENNIHKIKVIKRVYL